MHGGRRGRKKGVACILFPTFLLSAGGRRRNLKLDIWLCPGGKEEEKEERGGRRRYTQAEKGGGDGGSIPSTPPAASKARTKKVVEWIPSRSLSLFPLLLLLRRRSVFLWYGAKEEGGGSLKEESRPSHLSLAPFFHVIGFSILRRPPVPPRRKPRPCVRTFFPL